MTPAISDADFTYKLLIALSLLGNLILLWWKFSGKAETRTIAPNPLNVRAATEFVTTDHCALSHRNFEERLDRVEKNIRELFQLQRGMAETVAEFKGTVEPLKDLATKFSRDVGRLEGILQKTN